MTTDRALLHVELVTPHGVVADVETDAVTAPGELGEFEIFAGHVPFLASLHPGVLTLGEEKAVQYIAVGPGFLEVTADGLIRILAERAVAGKDVDKAAAQAELDVAEPALKEWKGDEAAYATLRSERDWAKAQLDASSR